MSMPLRGMNIIINYKLMQSRETSKCTINQAVVVVHITTHLLQLKAMCRVQTDIVLIQGHMHENRHLIKSMFPNSSQDIIPDDIDPIMQ